MKTFTQKRLQVCKANHQQCLQNNVTSRKTSKRRNSLIIQECKNMQSSSHVAPVLQLWYKIAKDKILEFRTGSPVFLLRLNTSQFLSGSLLIPPKKRNEV